MRLSLHSPNVQLLSAMPESTLWSADPHTFVKHALLKRYIGAWFSILSTSYRRLVYIDGFAGPGEYEGGELGSPIVVLEAAIGNERLDSPRFLFVEERKDRARHLDKVLKRYQVPPSFEVKVEEDEFEAVLERELDGMERGGSDPVFAFVDPFGYLRCPLRSVFGVCSGFPERKSLCFSLGEISIAG